MAYTREHVLQDAPPSPLRRNPKLRRVGSALKPALRYCTRLRQVRSTKCTEAPVVLVLQLIDD